MKRPPASSEVCGNLCFDTLTQQLSSCWQTAVAVVLAEGKGADKGAGEENRGEGIIVKALLSSPATTQVAYSAENEGEGREEDFLLSRDDPHLD